MMKTEDAFPTDNTFFHKLSFGGTLKRMLSVYKLGFFTFHKLMLVVGGSFTILWAFLLQVLCPAFGVDPWMAEDDYYVAENSAAFTGLFLLQIFVAGLFVVVGHTALIRATTDVYLQRPTNRVTSYLEVGFRKFCPNFCASILIGLGVAVGLVFFILPGVFVGIMWVLAHAVIVIEGMGIIAGIKRSWSLVLSRWCYVFCTKFVLSAPFSIFHMIWVFYVAPPHFTFVGFIVGIIPSLLFAPFLSILITVIYINLRVEKDGLDAQALASDLGEPINEESEMAENNNDEVAGDGHIDVAGIPDVC